ncbi:hypothetical protein Agabi119p4_2988 [Agaricus bisporus var. burnettii]|uniref:EH domain-containing protein n=1 Tax=Agaricus bisporus var. burnettii TaxID=192524 RepID=A0A8H7KIQ7_AGABI|nr:hypothetical protein Agabi119p4_2988 [Agaricus bisporus var. burnettii]
MPTSTAIQSRIDALHAAAARPPSPPPPPPPLFDLNDWVLDDMTPPTPNLRIPPKPKPKPPALQMKTKSPVLPRRKSTQENDSSWLYPPLGGVEAHQNGGKGNHAQASSVSSFHSVSLSDTDSSALGLVANTNSADRVPSSPSLTESFEEVSIPPPPPPLPQRPSSMPTTHSPSQKLSQPILPAATPLPYVPRRVPPPPPSRASDRSSIQSSTSSSQSRRSSSSVQTPTLITSLPLSPSSSILSPATAKPKRQTPVPLAAQKRYGAVFNANIIQRRRVAAIRANEPRRLAHAEAKRGRQAAGWRGLSVDLITATPEELQDAKGKNREQSLPQVDESVGPNDRLEGSIIKSIWSRSGIEKRKLVEIWNECDADKQGSLDLESFVRGMWRIDEQLRRSQTHPHASRNVYTSNLSLRNGLDSLKIKPKRGESLRRNSSRSSHNSSTSNRPITNVYADYRPPPVPKLILH